MYAFPFGALMTRLLLVMLFTGPMNEMPPGINATVEVGGCVGATVGTSVGELVVAVLPVAAVLPAAGCEVLPPVPAHAVIKINIARTAVHANIP